MFDFKITIYGRPMCDPCDALKALFVAADIPFEYVNIRELPESERERVSAEIRRVSRLLDKAYVPAVAVQVNGSSVWFSHEGDPDKVPPMFDTIKAYINWA